MTAFVLHDAQGQPKSIATGTPPNPVPNGLSAVTCSDAEFVGLTSGTHRWNPTAKAVEVDTVKAQAATNQATIEGQMDTSLDAMRAHVIRGTFTAAQRDNALLLVLRVCIGLVRLARNRLDAAD